MSFDLILIKCPKCKKMYSFNPDVGKIKCPYCMGTGKSIKKLRKNYKE